MAGIPQRTVDSKTIVGHTLVGVRQRVKRLGQFNGVAPVISTSPLTPTISPLDGAVFVDDLYTYADIQPFCFIGDPADVNAQVILKAVDPTVDARAIKIEMAEAAALHVAVLGGYRISIEFVPGTTTYAALQAALAADVNISAAFTASLPGTGAPNVVLQDLTFEDPTPVQAVQDDGGIFVFTPGIRASLLKSISLVCGAGSVVDVYIQDKGGANPRKILSGVSGVADEHAVGLPFLSSEEIRVVETVSGAPGAGLDKYATLYLVKERVY